MSARRASGGFTLIELMIVVAVIAVILTLAAPSFRDMILMQRLRGINAQLVTDMAFARSEAISRGTFVRVHFKSNTATSCYTISAGPSHTGEPRCDCLLQSCPTNAVGIRTVQYPASDSVMVAPRIPSYNRYTIDPRTGGIVVIGPDGPEPSTPEIEIESSIDSSRVFRNAVSVSGRIKVCTPSGSNTGGEAC